MFVLVSYDVKTSDPGGTKRLRRVARVCRDHGQRVQYSVFECILEPEQWTMLWEKLINEIDKNADSLRFYFLGANWRHRVEHVGAKNSLDQEGPLII